MARSPHGSSSWWQRSVTKVISAPSFRAAASKLWVWYPSLPANSSRRLDFGLMEKLACDQTKLSAVIAGTTAFLATLPMETNWSLVGSAQQYHGSLKNGTGRPA